MAVCAKKPVRLLSVDDGKLHKAEIVLDQKIANQFIPEYDFKPVNQAFLSQMRLSYSQQHNLILKFVQKKRKQLRQELKNIQLTRSEALKSLEANKCELEKQHELVEQKFAAVFDKQKEAEDSQT